MNELYMNKKGINMRIFLGCAVTACMVLCMSLHLNGMNVVHKKDVQSTDLTLVAVHQTNQDPHAADHVIIDVQPEPSVGQQDVVQQQPLSVLQRLLQTNVQQQFSQTMKVQILALSAKLNLQEIGESV